MSMDKNQKLTETTSFKADDIHLLTKKVLFNGKEYSSDYIIPYPVVEPKIITDFQVSMIWEKENEIDEADYDETYNKQGFDFGWGYLWTDIIAKFSINDRMDEVGIVAQCFIKYFPVFLDKLNRDKQAVYNNEEYSPFKWLAWIKDKQVRLIHQDYRFDEANTEFDVLIDKDLFFSACKNMITTMQKYADSDLKRYNRYIEEKYRQ